MTMSRLGLVLLSLLTLASCGGGSGGSITLPNGDIMVIEGSAAKGPFLADSTVTLNVLSTKATATSATATAIRPVLAPNLRSATLVTDTQGRFDPSGIVFGTGERFVEAHVEGYYFDELTGKRSQDVVTLRGVVDITTQAMNINVLTDLSRGRTLKLVRNRIAGRCTVAKAISASAATPPAADVTACSVSATDFQDARKQAEQEVLRAFNIPASALGSSTFADLNARNIASLSVLGTANTGDQVLLAMSALIVQIGQDGSGISEFLGAFEADIADDGVLNNSDTNLAAQIARASAAVNFSAVASNMNAFYKSNRYVAVDLENWVDPTGGVNGVIAGKTEYLNVSTITLGKGYEVNPGTFQAASDVPSCLHVVTTDAIPELQVNGTVVTQPYLVAANTSVQLKLKVSPTPAGGASSTTSTPSMNMRARLVSMPPTNSGIASAPNWTCPATPPSNAQGLYYVAATPPGLNLFAQQFIGDFARCFNLTSTARVRTINLLNPDIPEVTSMDPACQPLAGSPRQQFLSNGYNFGQQYFWMLTDSSMTKTARIIEMDVLRYMIRNNQPTATVRFRYVDRFGRMNYTIAAVQQDPAEANGPTAGWFNIGNQHPIDAGLSVGVRRYMSIPVQASTAVNRTLREVKINYQTAFLATINNKGPGTRLPDGTPLSAVRVTGPGLPSAGLIFIPPQQRGLAEFDFSNMDGTLPFGIPVNQQRRCGWTVPSGGYTPGMLPANCPLVWVGLTPWTAPSNATASGVTFASLTWPTITSFVTQQPTGGIWLPSNTGALMTQGTEYLFSLYYGDNPTPARQFTKQLLTGMPTLAEVQTPSWWVKLESVGSTNLSSVTNVPNPFEAVRPVAGTYTLDVTWTGQTLNKVEISSANTNLQTNFYPRATPGDTVARGLSGVTLAPQLDQDGISREMQWTVNTDALGMPITSTGAPVRRTISLGHRSWDGMWKSQDFFIESATR